MAIADSTKAHIFHLWVFSVNKLIWLHARSGWCFAVPTHFICASDETGHMLWVVFFIPTSFYLCVWLDRIHYYLYWCWLIICLRMVLLYFYFNTVQPPHSLHGDEASSYKLIGWALKRTQLICSSNYLSRDRVYIIEQGLCRIVRLCKLQTFVMKIFDEKNNCSSIHPCKSYVSFFFQFYVGSHCS
jgi:hypothetical protein